MIANDSELKFIVYNFFFYYIVSFATGHSIHDVADIQIDTHKSFMRHTEWIFKTRSKQNGTLETPK